MQILVILALLFALVISIFAVQNSSPVDIRFLGWRYQGISLVVIILGAFSMGALLTIIINMVKNLKTMIKIKELNSKIRLLNEEKQRLQEEMERMKQNAHTPQSTESGK